MADHLFGCCPDNIYSSDVLIPIWRIIHWRSCSSVAATYGCVFVRTCLSDNDTCHVVFRSTSLVTKYKFDVLSGLMNPLHESLWNVWLRQSSTDLKYGHSNSVFPFFDRIRFHLYCSQLPLPQGEGLGICQTNVLTNRLEEV